MNSKVALRYAIFSAAITFTTVPVAAQFTGSGSSGSDGALNYTTPGTYVFNPKSFTPPLDPANDGVFNFTTINIAAGVTVQIPGNVINSPVVWLAQGAVQINGTIDLSGQAGFSAVNTTQRTNTVPGAGGYGGGYPAVGANPAGLGLGPAGGTVVGCDNRGVGGFTGNQFLVPLVGGSGASGGSGWAGGAGGGAILVASSVSISGSGSINASGGAAYPLGGQGAGGAIRLVAPAVTITGTLSVAAGARGASCGENGVNGIVRVEGFQIGALNVSGNLYTATPFGLFVTPSGIPAVSVVSVGGIPVAANPTGTFTVPDVIVNSIGPLPVAIQAANVPIGTVVTLVVFSENGADQTILSTPLAGTLAASTATATITLPPGFSKGFVKASF